MNNAHKLPARGFRRQDLPRFVISLGCFATVFAACYYALPFIQALVVPHAPGGIKGPWVVRPIIAIHFGACAVLTAVSMPFVMRLFRKRWLVADQQAGSRYDPFQGRRFAKARIYIAGFALFLIYAGALVLYVRSWEEIGPSGIVQQLPWGRLVYFYDQVISLETVPAGMRSESLAKNGPWYEVRFGEPEFGNPRSFNFSRDNEGCTDADIAGIAAFIAEQARQPWQLRRDAK